MKKTSWYLVATLAIGVALSSQALAERFTLEQAIAYALQNNPSLAANSHQALAAAARVESAKSGRWPQLNFSAAVTASNNPLDAFANKLYTSEVTGADFDPAKLNNPSDSSLLASELSMHVPVYDGGRVGAQVRGATALLHATQLQYEQQRQFVAYNTEQAYLSALNAMQAVSIAEEGVRAAQEHANTTAQLVREGRIIQSDQLTAELNLASLQSMREQANGRLRLALTDFKWTVGLSQDALIELVPERIGEPGDISQSISEQQKRALEQRKDLQALQQHLDAQRADIDVARSGRRPQLNITAAGDIYQNGFEADNAAWRVMAVLSMPLFEGGYSTHQIDAAQREVNATDASLDALQQRISSQIQNAREGIIEAHARLEIAKGNVDKAQRNVSQIKQRYGQGRTILIDLLQAERMLVEARNEAATALYGLQRGLSDLRYATGDTINLSISSKQQ